MPSLLFILLVIYDNILIISGKGLPVFIGLLSHLQIMMYISSHNHMDSVLISVVSILSTKHLASCIHHYHLSPEDFLWVIFKIL